MHTWKIELLRKSVFLNWNYLNKYLTSVYLTTCLFLLLTLEASIKKTKV